MKRITLYFSGLLIALAFLTGCIQNRPSIGRSMGSSTLQVMKENHDKGVEYIEVSLKSIIGKDTTGIRERAAEYKARVDSSGLKIWSVHMPFSRKIDISLSDSAKRTDAVNYMKEMIKVAGILKPQHVVLHPSYEPIAPDERMERLEKSRQSIGLLAPAAQEIGAILCIENLPRTCLGKNGQEMMYLIEGYDNVGICFDVNHLLYQSHEDFLKSIEKRTIKTVHISDYDFADERHLLPGVGKIDWKPLWDGIISNGYKGIMMFECTGTPEDFIHARNILTGKFIPEKSHIDADSLAFRNADWEITDLGKGAQSMYAQVPMFFSTQSICCIKYPASEYRTEILHRPGKMADKPSVIGKDTKATAIVNAGYFHVKPRIPSVYFRIGDEVYGHTHQTETYRVDGILGFKDKDGKEILIEYSDTTQYETVTEGWHTAMASGPMLVVDGELVVPLLTGDGADGDNIAAMKEEQKNGSKVRTHYSSAQFYDKRHPRAAIGKDDKGNIYYVVIDGRFKKQGDGASIYETAYICKMLGMTDAINLDGGGSSTLWSGKTGVINHPYDNKKWDHDGERAVPNMIAAY